MAQPAQSAGEKKSRRKKSPPISPVDDYISGPGITTIAPDVLITIARLTTLETPGVCRMNPVPGTVSRFRRGAADGIILEIKNDYVMADLYVVMKNNVNMREVSRNIQHNVRRAISEMVGMQVGRVNIHIEDIEFTPV